MAYACVENVRENGPAQLPEKTVTFKLGILWLIEVRQ
jgi:hypothetical protein